MTQLISEIMSDKAVCRTAPAKPGLLSIREDQIRTQLIIGGTSFTRKQYQKGSDQNMVYYSVEDQLQMGQNEENFWYASFLGRTSQKNYPVNTCAMRVHYNTAGPE